ncbi:MAG: hypothetical protein JWR19_392 [Pedosphaera sp.]|nr:hypothetical protein [Pedosphaera sp.]
MKIKLMKHCLLAVAMMLIASGCLTSPEPFYQESDIKVDDRLIGTYHAENEQTGWQIEKDLDQSNRYIVTLFSDLKPCFMRFSGVLFQVGTNRFFDMLPMLESCDHVAGSTPGPIEIMQGITLQSLHLVVRMDATTNGLRYGVIDQQGLLATAKKFPEYFQARAEQLPRMVPDTKRQRDFLMRFGGDTNIFKPVEIKRGAKPSK